MVEIRRLSNAPLHHFFGYYGINAWSSDGRFHLSLESGFCDRRPTVGDTAGVGVIDCETGEFIRFSETPAFNFQQGCMLNWIDPLGKEEICFNWFDGKSLCAKAIDFKSRNERIIESAVAAVSPDKKTAMGLNYIRNFKCRKVVGYDLEKTVTPITHCPDDDGLYHIDLTTGKANMVLSIRTLIDELPESETEEGPAWFDHIEFNPSGTRIFFMCRICTDKYWHSSFWTVNPDGSGLKNQIPYKYWISHFDWINDTDILVSSNVADGHRGFVKFTDSKYDFTPYAKESLPSDGHASFSNDLRFLLYDSNVPGERGLKELAMFDTKSVRKIPLGYFRHDNIYNGDIRCDLHPRFNSDCSLVTFDSVHEGTRQIYLADVSEYTL